MAKHTLKTAIEILNKKNINFIEVLNIDTENNLIYFKDKKYGEYRCGLDCLSPSRTIPLHTKRKTENKVEVLKNKVINTVINGYLILNVHSAKEIGYKTRGLLLEYKLNCGHSSFGSLSYIKTLKDEIKCQSCLKTKHGERSKDNNERKKRTKTYIYWVSNNKKLPKKFNNYIDFLNEVGERPSSSYKLEEINGKYFWITKVDLENKETNLISNAIRQAFRYSELYKNCLENAKVETEEGTRYICAKCKNPSLRSNVDIDHINPIQPLDGSKLKKEDLIKKIWTDQIQVLDQKCHVEKTVKENQLRKKFRKLLK